MNILLDHFNLHLPWGYDYFRHIIKPNMRVTIIPLAFHEEWIHDALQWEEWYGKYTGSHYKMFTQPLFAFGIKEDNISYINYFRDDTPSATKKIIASDIIIFSGGIPNKVMDRLKEMKLMDTIENYRGIIIGWSAGSMVQCEDYYISPDEDFPDYTRFKGVKGIKGFAIEVHYQGEPQQLASIQRYIQETGNKVYITSGEGAIIVDDGNITLLGNAREYGGDG